MEERTEQAPAHRHHQFLHPQLTFWGIFKLTSFTLLGMVLLFIGLLIVFVAWSLP